MGTRLGRVEKLIELKAPDALMVHENSMLGSIETACRNKDAVSDEIIRRAGLAELPEVRKIVKKNLREIAKMAVRPNPCGKVEVKGEVVRRAIELLVGEIDALLSLCEAGGQKEDWRELLVLWARIQRLEPSNLPLEPVGKLDRMVRENWDRIISYCDVEFDYRDWSTGLRFQDPLQSFIEYDAANLVHWAAIWGLGFWNERRWHDRMASASLDEKWEEPHQAVRELRDLGRAEALMRELRRTGRHDLFKGAEGYANGMLQAFRKFPPSATGEPMSALTNTVAVFRTVGNWKAEEKAAENWWTEFRRFVHSVVLVGSVFGR
jgi:hypothetical protein